MITKTAIIRNNAGIHVRPTGVIIKECSSLEDEVTIQAKGMDTDLKDHIGLLAMGLCKGDEVLVIVKGSKEAETAEKIVELLERHYDFPPRD